MKYGCLKINRCSEDNFRIGKQGGTWNSGNIGDNATWDNSKLKCNDILIFHGKNHHNVWLIAPICMNTKFPCRMDI